MENYESAFLLVIKFYETPDSLHSNNQYNLLMGNNGSSSEGFNFVCFRCGRIITSGEKMITVHTSIEMSVACGSIDTIEDYAISSLCFGCASIILTEAVINKRLTMPTYTAVIGEV